MKKAWLENMYELKINGIALLGWLVLSVYGLVSLITDTISAFN